jgi:hypothetical protein
MIFKKLFKQSILEKFQTKWIKNLSAAQIEVKEERRGKIGGIRWGFKSYSLYINGNIY